MTRHEKYGHLIDDDWSDDHPDPIEWRPVARMLVTAVVIALAWVGALYSGAYVVGLGYTLGVKAAWGEPSYEVSE